MIATLEEDVAVVLDRGPEHARLAADFRDVDPLARDPEHDSVYVRFECLTRALEEARALAGGPNERVCLLHLSAAEEIVRLLRGQVLR